jgi:hypothetical protein
MSTADQLRILAGWRKEDACLLRKAADELEELQADAERYRAMRREALISKKRGRWRVTWHEPEAQPTDSGVTFRDNVDSAVDHLIAFHAECDARKEEGMTRITESACSCGQKALIEHGSKNTFRKDRKRIFYSPDESEGICAFRCRNCLEPVHETVPGAEFEVKR